MPVNNYITSSCRISNNIAFKNETVIFQNKDAPLNLFLISVYKFLNIPYPKFYKMDNLSKLGWLASEILLQRTGVSENYHAEEIGIVISNSESSLDTDLKYFETVNDIPSPALFVYTLPNIMIGEISIRNNFKGENAFFIFERFDADFTQHYVNDLLDNEGMKACICGWVDLLGEEYNAVLFLVEKTEDKGFAKFSKENMVEIFN